MSETIPRCHRCGAAPAPAIEGWVGFTGDFKQRVLAEVCQDCWSAWLEVQLMAINEYRLQLGLAEHREVLADLASQFFGFAPPADEDGGQDAEPAGTPAPIEPENR